MMHRRTTTLYLAVLSAVALAACGDSTGLLDRPELEGIEIEFGLDQSAVEGEFLEDWIIAHALVEDGSRYHGAVFARIEQGNGRIELPGAVGEGNGVVLQGTSLEGTIAFPWAMGPSAEQQRIVLFALRTEGDTVSTTLAAVSIPAGSHAR